VSAGQHAAGAIRNLDVSGCHPVSENFAVAAVRHLPVFQAHGQRSIVSFHADLEDSNERLRVF